MSKVKSLIPLLDRVLVRRIKSIDRTASGVLIPEKAQEKLNEGDVIAVGKGALDRDGKHIPIQVAVGDRVLLPSYGGQSVILNKDDEELILLRDSEILGKIEVK